MTIEVDGLSYSKGDFHLSCGNLSIEEGKVTCIIGKNGSGKSTLLKLINGTLKPEMGSVTVDGIPVEKLKPRELSRKISFVQQEMPDPMGFTVREVLSVSGYSRDFDDGDMMSALMHFEAEQLINRKFADLSGGERRLVALSASIYQNAETIIMDEPTTFLDVDKQILVNEVIERIRESGKTILVVMHDLGTAYRISDNVVLMKGGLMIGHGDTESIMTPGNLKRTFDVEFDVFDTPSGKEFKGRRPLASP